MEDDPVSLHLAEFVERASPIATKAAIGTSVATSATGAVAVAWTLPDIATLVGIVCSIAATTAAIMFGYLNYKINKKRGEK
jgi:hypothetical protein